MKAFLNDLNELLMKVYKNVMRLEEKSLKSSRLRLSINEMHLIEAVGRGGEEGAQITRIAEDLDIKAPSATNGVNKLEKKGFVEKYGSPHDGRAVHVRLTREGKKVDAYHRFYHRSMVGELSRDMTPEELHILASAMQKLNCYLERSISQ